MIDTVYSNHRITTHINLQTKHTVAINHIDVHIREIKTYLCQTYVYLLPYLRI